PCPFSNCRTNFSISFNLVIFTPVAGNDKVWEYDSLSTSKQVYSIDTNPISVEQVMPKVLATVSIESRTRQAPVPQLKSIIPTRPTIEVFSTNVASCAIVLLSLLKNSSHRIFI